jgi:hypothetical protein
VEETHERITGQCWHNLFRNPVVVMGYPIPRRPKESQGLEIPLNHMAALIQQNRLSLFAENILIKGFSSLLVAMKVVENTVVWHHLFNEDSSHLPFTAAVHKTKDSANMRNDDLTVASLTGHRHIVGWCPEAKYHVGM